MIANTLRSSLAAATVALLAACATDPNAPVQLSAIQDAVCMGDYARAQSLAERAQSEGMTGMALHVLRGYALEKEGKPMAARPVYHAVIKSRSEDPVKLECEELVFEGPASQVAYDRMRVTNIDLAALDVTEEQLLSVNPLPPPVEEPAPMPMPTQMMAPPHVLAPPPAPMGEMRQVTPSPAGVWIHLESYKTPKWEESGWRTLMKKHSALLKGHDKVFRKVDLGKKGTAYRLGAGNFASEHEAQQLCTKFKSAGQYCDIMTR